MAFVTEALVCERKRLDDIEYRYGVATMLSSNKYDWFIMWCGFGNNMMYGVYLQRLYSEICALPRMPSYARPNMEGRPWHTVTSSLLILSRIIYRITLKILVFDRLILL